MDKMKTVLPGSGKRVKVDIKQREYHNPIDAASAGMSAAVKSLSCEKCRRMLYNGKCRHCDNDHGVIGWIEEEDGNPEITCEDIEDCHGCPQFVNEQCGMLNID